MTPSWMYIAKMNLGVFEVPGPKSNPKILEWAKAVGRFVGIRYADDDTPWCGLFAAMCVKPTADPPPFSVRASAWETWGDPLTDAIEGAVLVFHRVGGGHVGFYAGETSTAYRVLGGNQSNRVSYTWIAKSRCVAIRWPKGYPKIAQPIKLTQTGALSSNEA